MGATRVTTGRLSQYGIAAAKEIPGLVPTKSPRPGRVKRSGCMPMYSGTRKVPRSAMAMVRYCSRVTNGEKCTRYTSQQVRKIRHCVLREMRHAPTEWEPESLTRRFSARANF